MAYQFKIKVRTQLTPYVYEQLEEALRRLFQERGIKATIEDSVTGNTTVSEG